jgi:hypothetical protein
MFMFHIQTNSPIFAINYGKVRSKNDKLKWMYSMIIKMEWGSEKNKN